MAASKLYRIALVLAAGWAILLGIAGAGFGHDDSHGCHHCALITAGRRRTHDPVSLSRDGQPKADPPTALVAHADASTDDAAILDAEPTAALPLSEPQTLAVAVDHPRPAPPSAAPRKALSASARSNGSRAPPATT